MESPFITSGYLLNKSLSLFSSAMKIRCRPVSVIATVTTITLLALTALAIIPLTFAEGVTVSLATRDWTLLVWTPWLALGTLFFTSYLLYIDSWEESPPKKIQRQVSPVAI